jgi:hypothetical protein
LDDHPLELFNPVFGLPPDIMHQADLGLIKNLWEWLKAAIDDKFGSQRKRDALAAIDK